jgi:hypothetical protein
MSAMKDYLMWLESKGIAEYDEYQDEWHFTVEDSESEELIEQYNTDEEWHTPESDQHLLENPDEWGWSPEDFWFQEDGGLTADAKDHLYQNDTEGDFV